ncbi:regulatory protein [Desulfobotulus alkaliphilus]|uniref:Regulatory protein RecX n=1 Tax=Desulfobotulus alkaliphilus TaxID=622671 RepID=A0A562RZF1_9BACT|nr:regulatory protein RecX [Desulfobotulus alkaliphilus]TWI74318.1 regulatory protein [Desulfobotulus alkaliphilus]
MSEDLSASQKNALAMALAMLSRRSLSRMELHRRLLKKGVGEKDADSVLTICMERGYIDENERAFQIVQSALRSGYGPRRIHADLRKGGIPDDLGERMLEESLKESGENILTRTALRKLSTIHENNPLKRKAKLYRFLISRGFPSPDILDFIQTLD